SAWCQLNVLAVRTAARATLSPYTTLFRSRPNRASLSNCTPLLYNNLWFLKKVVEPPKGSRISAQVEVVYIAGLLQIILPFEFEIQCSIMFQQLSGYAQFDLIVLKGIFHFCQRFPVPRGSSLFPVSLFTRFFPVYSQIINFPHVVCIAIDIDV